MYITTVIKAKPPKQLTFEEMFNMMVSQNWGEKAAEPIPYSPSRRDYTKTWKSQRLPEHIRLGCHPDVMISVLEKFNNTYQYLFDDDLSKHYHTFRIPKRSGGWREINAPDDALKLAQLQLKSILETYFYASHHAAAFAYIKGRSTRDAVAVHQYNESKWFLKTDLSGFFPSTTLDFVMHMLSMIYPFAVVMEDEAGKEQLKKALSLCFLNGSLPMGTPVSPMLTNIIMTPFDYELSKWLRNLASDSNNPDHVGRQFVYTRYADDIYISCRIGFDAEFILSKIRDLFSYFQAPYIIKPEKTKYVSSAGKNFILGCMLNKDNRITIGHVKRHTIEAMVFNYFKDRESGKYWRYEDLQYMQGLLSYYKSIDKGGCEALIHKYENKFNRSLPQSMKADFSIA